MTLLTICQNVAENVPIKVPTIIVNNNNKDAKLLLACVQKAGKSLARRPEEGWVVMQKEHTFTTVNGTASYALPSDFGFLLNDTLWDRSNYWEMKGPLTPKEWQIYKSSILGSTDMLRKRFRIKGTDGTKFFFIDPTPTASDDLVFEYASNAWCESSEGTAQTSFQADDDVAIIDEYLIELDATWRMLARLGLAYEEEKAEAENEISKAVARDGGAPEIMIGGHEPTGLLTSRNAPETGFGS